MDLPVLWIVCLVLLHQFQSLTHGSLVPHVGLDSTGAIPKEAVLTQHEASSCAISSNNLHHLEYFDDLCQLPEENQFDTHTNTGQASIVAAPCVADNNHYSNLRDHFMTWINPFTPS